MCQLLKLVIVSHKQKREYRGEVGNEAFNSYIYLKFYC